MKVYIAGPMTGIPQFNYPHFSDVAKMLREEGFQVVSPAEMDDPEVRAISLASPDGNLDTIESHGMTHGQFLARDVELIADDGIEAVAVLNGWENSSGARHETFVAFLNHLPIYRWANLAMNAQNPAKWQPVPLLELARAWTQEPSLIIYKEPFRG